MQFFIRTTAFAWLLLLTASAGAQDEKLKEMRGTIRQLDLKTGNLTLLLLTSDKQIPMGLAARDVPVTNPLGDKLTVADLRAELRVAVKVRNEDEIVAVRVEGPYQHGQIKKVDAARRTILYKDVITDKTITVPAEVKIVSAGKEIALQNLKPGDPIQVLHALDRKTILQIQTGKGTSIRDPYLRIARYYGILAELNHEKRNVQVFVQSIDAGMIKTYDVSPDAYLRLMYHFKPVSEVGFDQFAKWVKIHYIVDRDTGTITNIDADLPIMLRRKVRKLDAQAGQITVEDELTEKTLPLAPDVKVLTPRGDGKLADVTDKRIVTCGLSLDRTRVLVLYLWDK